MSRLLQRGRIRARGAVTARAADATPDDEVVPEAAGVLSPGKASVPTNADLENLSRAVALSRVDLTEHNRAGQAPTFSSLVSQATTIEQFAHPDMGDKWPAAHRGRGLFRPLIAFDEGVAELVSVRRVDMNRVPADLGPCNVACGFAGSTHVTGEEGGWSGSSPPAI